MIINAISDIHGNLPEGVDCDLLFICGDISPTVNHEVWYQRMWFFGDFIPWLSRQKYNHCLLVAGNHDFFLEEESFTKSEKFRYELSKVNCTYLQDSFVYYEDLCIYGSPWQPEFCNWAFNLTEEKLAEKWLTIPRDCDILLLHGPPKGYGCQNLRDAGSISLTNRIRKIQPKMVFCGHIHEGYGEYQIGNSRIFNVSSVDINYKLRPNPIWSIEL